MVLGKNTECIPHPLLPQAPGGVAVKVGVLGSEGGWKEAASVNFLGCGGCGSWLCTGLCRPPLGREGAELGVTARVVSSSPPLSGAEPSAVAAARRELSRSRRRECGCRGWAAGARTRLVLVSSVAGWWGGGGRTGSGLGAGLHCDAGESQPGLERRGCQNRDLGERLTRLCSEEVKLN